MLSCMDRSETAMSTDKCRDKQRMTREPHLTQDSHTSHKTATHRATRCRIVTVAVVEEYTEYNDITTAC